MFIYIGGLLAENFSQSDRMEVEIKRARLPATGPFAFSEEALYLFRTKSVQSMARCNELLNLRVKEGNY